MKTHRTVGLEGGDREGTKVPEPVVGRRRGPNLRVGFVPLLDAAPLIVALEWGLFAAAGLKVELQKQIGWANVRDKLTFGQLDASHALQGMPLTSQLGRDWFIEPLVAAMRLTLGEGAAITLHQELVAEGVNSGADLARFIHRERAHRQLIFGHVFGCSSHHYLLRQWLREAGLDPDHDVKLCIIPPSQIGEHMAKGYLDGFCVGEPWNTLAEQQGYGKIMNWSRELVPGHPDKILAVTGRWAQERSEELEVLIGVLLRASTLCRELGRRQELARLLARKEYLGQPVELMEQCLNQTGVYTTPAADLFPSKTHTLWMLGQLIQWGEVSAELDFKAIAERCSATEVYRRAAEGLGVVVPASDYPEMRDRGGKMFGGSSAELAGLPRYRGRGAQALVGIA